MGLSAPRELARTSGSQTKVDVMRVISASATLLQLEGLKVQLSSMTCSPAMQHASKKWSEGRFPAQMRVGVDMQQQHGPRQHEDLAALVALRSTTT